MEQETQDHNTQSSSSPGSDNSTPSAPSKKRHMACEQCRKRKLKCSGTKPQCSACSRNARQCVYLNSFKKSGPKPGHLKSLEKRLEKMEFLLRANGIKLGPDNDDTVDDLDSSDQQTNPPSKDNPPTTLPASEFSFEKLEGPLASTSLEAATRDVIRSELLAKQDQRAISKNKHFDTTSYLNKSLYFPNGSVDLFAHVDYKSGRISGGGDTEIHHNVEFQLVPVNVDEAYPNDNITYSLLEIYFNRMHPHYCIINKSRFYTSLASGHSKRPKPYLFYAILLVSAAISEKFTALEKEFYTRCVKYIDRAEKTGFGEDIINIQYVQSLVLLCIYEHRCGSFARAWIYTGKATRAVHMNNTHDIDSQIGSRFTGLFSSNDIGTKLGEVDLDEARRVLWIVYILDNYGSVATGWPISIHDEEISTLVPLDDLEEIQDGKKNHSLASLDDILRTPERYLRGMQSFTAFNVVLIHLLFRAFRLMTETPQHDDFSKTGYWWSKHNMIQIQIDRLSRVLPAYDQSSPDINSIICLHILHQMCYLSLYRAAIVRLKTLGGPYETEVFEELCFKATTNLTMSLRFSTNLYDVIEHPGPLFCIYTAARSFLTFIEDKTAPSYISKDTTQEKDKYMILRCKSYLDFLLTVFNILRPRMFLAECFYDKIYNDLIHAHIGRPTDMPKPTGLKPKCPMDPNTKTGTAASRVQVIHEQEVAANQQTDTKSQSLQSFWGAVKTLLNNEKSNEGSDQQSPASESSSSAETASSFSTNTSSSSSSPVRILHSPATAGLVMKQNDLFAKHCTGLQRGFTNTGALNKTNLSNLSSSSLSPSPASLQPTLSIASENPGAIMPTFPPPPAEPSSITMTTAFMGSSPVVSSTISSVRANGTTITSSGSSYSTISATSSSPAATSPFPNLNTLPTFQSSGISNITPPLPSTSPLPPQVTAFPMGTTLPPDSGSGTPMVATTPQAPVQARAQAQAQAPVPIPSEMIINTAGSGVGPSQDFGIQQPFKYPEYLDWNSEMNFETIIEEILGNNGQQKSLPAPQDDMPMATHSAFSPRDGPQANMGPQDYRKLF